MFVTSGREVENLSCIGLTWVVEVVVVVAVDVVVCIVVVVAVVVAVVVDVACVVVVLEQATSPVSTTITSIRQKNSESPPFFI